ncbi:hypothetical protein AB0M38_07215 [Streptomyces sp. NPDC051742]|uniref:hypothetical protein n=1 Tax=unclassified Streptomyces TaxID=2593676 RepID=UPI00342FEB7C
MGIRGVALEVVERMGLLEQATRARTRMRGMSILAPDDWQTWLRDGDRGFGIMPVRDNTEPRIAFGLQSAPSPTTSVTAAPCGRQLVVD